MWDSGRLVGFDTETTGVNPRQARIVTAAVVIRDHGDEVRTWLADPGVEIPAAAQAVHGISTAYAREHGRPAAAVVAELADTLERELRAGVPVVAFNAPYDLEILDRELARHGLTPLSNRLPAIRPIIDPLVLDRALVAKRRGKRRLEDLLKHYQIPHSNALHTAEVDVLATLDLAGAIARAYPRVAALDLDALHDYQVTAHRAWAEDFARFLSSRRGEPVRVSPHWPLPR
ncbi:MAG: exonuclease domain-containing protein [Actinomycetaceae bacterium]|nr:exonuclease domain-containing protein [Actinomycetaceae bacterium]